MAELQRISSLSILELLDHHGAVLEEIRRRKLFRTSNVVGELAELLFCRAFGWTLQPTSNKSVDAIGPDGVRYQIKGRMETGSAGSRELGAIRSLDANGFDFLAALLVGPRFQVTKAMLIPHSVVTRYAAKTADGSAHRLRLSVAVLHAEGTTDVTSEVAEAARLLA